MVQATLEKDFNICPTLHKSRNKSVIKYLPLNIRTLYRNLYHESMKARYTEQGIYRDNNSYKKMERLITSAKEQFPELITSP